MSEKRLETVTLVICQCTGIANGVRVGTFAFGVLFAGDVLAEVFQSRLSFAGLSPKTLFLGLTAWKSLR